MRVFVLDKNKNPMMPCHPARARQLLRSGRAKVYRKYPFTIILSDRDDDFETQDVELKVDPGSKTTGIALVGKFERGNEVIWQAELHHRGHQIVDSLLKRMQIRRSRRSRKTRYRKPRFLNRTNPKGWLPPSALSRVNNIVVWARRLISFSPIVSIEVETVRFDTQKMQNPEIKGVEYQQGTLQGYDIREYLLEKFDRTCVYCDVQNVPLEVEHVIPKSRGGSDRVSNLALSCSPCNTAKGSMAVEEFVKDKRRLAKIAKQLKQPLRDTAAMNVIRYRIGDELKKLGLSVNFWSGSRTKMNRIKQGYPKKHWIDASCVGDSGENVKLNADSKVLQITATGRGSRQMCLMNKYGFPRTKPKSAKRVHGFQTGDIARLTQPSGKYKGVHEGRISVRVSGYFDIATNGTKISASWKHFMLLQRFDGYAYSYHCQTSSV